MKKHLILFFGAVLLLIGSAEAKGRITISAGVSIYDPPGDVSSTLLFEIAARYRLSDKVTAELSVGWTQYSDVTLMPVQLNGEFHPLGAKVFDPYVGAGTGVYLTKIAEVTEATIGIQALAGLAFRPAKGFGFSAEVKYMLADITDGNSGGLTFGGGIEGTWETDL